MTCIQCPHSDCPRTRYFPACCFRGYGRVARFTTYSACSGVMPCSPMWLTFHSFHRNSYRTDITIRKVRPPAKTGDGPLRTNHAVTGRGGRACRHATCRMAAVWFPSAPAARYHVRASANDADAFCEGGGDGGQHRVSPRGGRDCGRLHGGRGNRCDRAARAGVTGPGGGACRPFPG